MVSTNDIRPGQSLIVDGIIFLILEYQHVKPGKGKAFVKTKLKNLTNGGVVDKTFRADEDVDQAFIDKQSFQYLYKDGTEYIFMNNENYEQIICENKLIGDSKIQLLEEGMIIKILTVDEEIVNINLPKNIKVEILNADAVVKGQTASSSFKNAETTKNLKLLVPSHIKVGDKILINSENLEYVEKAKN